MSQQINVYKQRVDQAITNQTNINSIPPLAVGNKFKELADIVDSINASLTVWDPVFAATPGYDKGNVVIYNGQIWESLVDINTVTPGSDITKWTAILTGIVFTSGDQIIDGVKSFSLSPQVPDGVSVNDAVNVSQLNSVVLDKIITGLAITVTPGLADVGTGSYILNNVIHNIADTLFALDSQDPVNSRYDVIYGDSNGQLFLLNGDLELTPTPPQIPFGTIFIGAILIPSLISTSIVSPVLHTDILDWNPAVNANGLTGFVSGAGSITSADTILSAIEKLDGNVNGILSNLTLTSIQITNALGYIPEDVANKVTDFSTLSDTLYPTVQAVANYFTANTNILSFNNGLTLSGSTVTIGGSLLNNTNINLSNRIFSLLDNDGTSSSSFQFGKNFLNLRNSVVADSSSTFFTLSDTQATIGTLDSSNQLGSFVFYKDQSTTYFDDKLNAILYAGDYSASMDANQNAIPSVYYVNTLIANSRLIIGATNGIDISRGNIELGANPLIHDTLLDISTQQFKISGTGVNDKNSLTMDYTSSTLSSSKIDTNASAVIQTLSTGGWSIIGSLDGSLAAGFIFDVVNGLQVYDSVYNQGLVYQGDYSAYFVTNNRSIPDVGFNDSRYLQTIVGLTAGGELIGTYPNPSLSNAAVISKLLTGYTSGAGVITASDSILSAIQKLNGNLNSFSTTTILTGEATGSGSGSFAVTLTNDSVIAKLLTGYVAGAGLVSSTDSLIGAIQKLDGNIQTQTLPITLSGEVTGTGNTGTPITATVSNAAVIGKLLTGFVSGAGTVTSSDTILSAIQKVTGSIGLLNSVLNFRGLWNANTNSPALASGTGTTGDFWLVSTAGSTNLDGTTTWNIFDAAIFVGGVWNKIGGLPVDVLSVFGRVGNVTLLSSDVVTALGFTPIQLSSLSGTAPIVYNSGTGNISITQASGSTNGYLSASNWTTFNNKQNALGFTPIQLSSLSAAAPLSYNNSTGQFTISLATTSTNGYLSSADWNVFNSKQAALGFTPYNATNPAGYITAAQTVTLTNKSISGLTNTLTNIPNAALTNATISGVALGGSLFNLTNIAGITSLTYNGSATKTIGIDFTGAYTWVGVQTFQSAVTASAGLAKGTNIIPTLTAAANNNALSALYINPVFNNGGFTGVQNIAISHKGDIIPIGGSSIYSLGSLAVTYNTLFTTNINAVNYIIPGASASFMQSNGTTPMMRLFSPSGSLVIQNGGSFVDAGYRLDVTSSGTNGYFRAGSLLVNAANLPQAPTAAPGTNTTQIATTQFVIAQIALAGTGSVSRFNFTNANGITGVVATPTTTPTLTLTLGNITPTQVGTATAAQINFLTGVTSNIQTQLNGKGPILSGNGFVKATGTTISYDATVYAPLTSPGLLGTPTAPTAAPGTNTTQLATTAYVETELSNSAQYFSSAFVAGLGTLISPFILANNAVHIANISATGTPSSATYLRGDGSWSTVAGGGSTGVNGLTGTTSIGLGGTLSGDTTIAAGTHSLFVTVDNGFTTGNWYVNTSNIGFYLNDATRNTSVSVNLGQATIGASQSLHTGTGFITNSSIQVGLDISTFLMSGADGNIGYIIQPYGVPGIQIIDDISQIGLVYGNSYDYSINGKLNDLWIPNWGSVKDYINSLTFQNGITNNTGVIGLGGALLQDSIISVSTNSLSFNGNDGASTVSTLTISNTGIFQSLSDPSGSSSAWGANATTIGLTVNGISAGFSNISVNADNWSITTTDGANYKQLDASTGVPTSGIVVIDGVDNLGLVYHADYSANGILNPRWIPDVSTLSSWLTGTLTGNIDLNTASSYFQIGTLTSTSVYNVIYIDTTTVNLLASGVNGLEGSGYQAFSTNGLLGYYNQTSTINTFNQLVYDSTSIKLYSIFNDVTDATTYAQVLTGTNPSPYFNLGIYVNGNQQGITADHASTTGILVKDDINTFGLYYDADYSVNGQSNPLWIPNIGYIGSIISKREFISGGSSGLFQTSSSSNTFSGTNMPYIPPFDCVIRFTTGGILTSGTMNFTADYTDFTNAVITGQSLVTSPNGQAILAVKGGQPVQIKLLLSGGGTYRGIFLIERLSD